MIAPGRVPVRRQGDGRWPVAGWSGDYDWQGWIPFEALPRALDPKDGRLFNANNRIVPEGYPYLLTADWEAPYRARRLAELLQGSDFDLTAFAAIQADQYSLLAEDLLPILLEAEPGSPAAAAAIRELRGLGPGDASGRPRAAPVRGLVPRAVAPDPGRRAGPACFASFWGVRPRFMEQILKRRPVWCDDISTTPVETCAALASRALDRALADLARRYGPDQADWRWGEAHPARMAHAIFGDQPLLDRLFDIEIPSGGGDTTVDVGHFAPGDEQRPFANTHAASYRGLYDLADLDRSRWIAATGQSGNPLSSHYRDLTRLWADGESVPMTRRRGRLPQGGDRAPAAAARRSSARRARAERRRGRGATFGSS